MIERQWGRAALVGMLRAYRDGLDTPAVFQKVLGVGEAELVQRFGSWASQRFAKPLLAIVPWDGKSAARGAFADALKEGHALLAAKRLEEARASFARAAALFPEYTGEDAPPLMLARIARERGDAKTAVAELARYTALDESAWEANSEEATLHRELGDVPGEAAALERMLWIAPQDAPLHARLADAAERLHDGPRVVRERRAALALGPADRLEARYQLARALWMARDSSAARREILQVLEAAPGFEKAQALLLAMSGRKP